ncbi:hypothetical protein [Pseudolactococcus raffinolactis]|uniref:hypothetical protein n=1 Tax=Pseudolactococcus raffinolactis TaxID=1366 RepID=UPI00077BBEF2|nr:hypothetical protein [Lactococcus raffinolactis]HBZ60454.1 hypothetical protein [Lactococcus sp.]
MSEFDPLTTLASRLIAEDVIRRVNEYDKLQAKLKATERVLPYISKQETMRDLDISDNTMSKFESNGLQRYKPDYNSSLIYYLIDDICKFIVLAD